MSKYTNTLPAAAAITAPDTGSESPAPVSGTDLDHRVPIYKECMKNHAASINGNAVDGCMEYLPGITHVPADPSAIVCAACGCHRNFHRKEVMLVPPPAPKPPQAPVRVSPPSSPIPPPNSTPVPDKLIALCDAACALSPPHILAATATPPPHTPVATATPPPPHTGIMVTSIPTSSYSAFIAVPTTPTVTTVPAVSTINDFTTPSTLKSYRTKFTKLQKEKMLRFAEQSDWKFHKRNEEDIKAICNEVGIDKNVLKVWFHNNKARLRKKDHTSGSGSASASSTPITTTTTTSAAPKFRSGKKSIEIGGACSTSKESRGDPMV